MRQLCPNEILIHIRAGQSLQLKNNPNRGSLFLFEPSVVAACMELPSMATFYEIRHAASRKFPRVGIVPQLLRKFTHTHTHTHTHAQPCAMFDEHCLQEMLENSVKYMYMWVRGALTFAIFSKQKLFNMEMRVAHVVYQAQFLKWTCKEKSIYRWQSAAWEMWHVHIAAYEFVARRVPMCFNCNNKCARTYCLADASEARRQHHPHSVHPDDFQQYLGAIDRTVNWLLIDWLIGPKNALTNAEFKKDGFCFFANFGIDNSGFVDHSHQNEVFFFTSCKLAHRKTVTNNGLETSQIRQFIVTCCRKCTTIKIMLDL